MMLFFGDFLFYSLKLKMLSESIKFDKINCEITPSIVGMGKRTKIENPPEENRRT